MSEQQQETPVDVKIDYQVYEEENSRVLEINLASGNTEINIITDVPVDINALAVLVGSTPEAVRQVLGALDPEELA